MKRVKRITVRLVLISISFALAFMYFFFSANRIYQFKDSADLDHLPPVDAIVCLAGGRGRIAAAGDVWLKYWSSGSLDSPRQVPVLYFSGLGKNSSWPVLLRQLRKPVAQVIRPADVFIERESLNTTDNARWLAKYAEMYGWKRILLVTSTYHIKRAELIFKRVLQSLGRPLQIETISVHQDPFSSGLWQKDPNGIRVTLFEYVKLVYYQMIWE